MLNNIWETLTQWIIQVVLGFMDKMTALTAYAFSPQLIVFKSVFPKAIELYSFFVKVSIFLAVVILLIKLATNIFVTPNSHNYEPWPKLLFNFILFFILLWVVPNLLDYGVRAADTLYWKAATTINSDYDDPSKSGLSPFTTLFTTAKEAADAEAADADADADADTTVPKEFDPKNLDAGFMGGIVAFVMVLIVAKNYFMFLIEAAERYVVFGILTFFIPLGLAPFVSEETKIITKKYFQMWISELILLVFTGVFLAAFQYCVKLGADAFDTASIVAAGSSTAYKVGGGFLWTLFLAAFLKVGMRVDTYLNTLGLSAAQTGSGLAMAVSGGLGSLFRGAVNTGKGIWRSATNPNGYIARTKNGTEAHREAQANKRVLDNSKEDRTSNPSKQIGITSETANQTKEQALKNTTGRGGLHGDDAINYAEDMLKGRNGIIPDNAKITDANLGGMDEHGRYLDSTVTYEDSNGEKHTVRLSGEQPEDGCCITQNANGEELVDPMGNRYFATNADADAKAEASVAFNNDMEDGRNADYQDGLDSKFSGMDNEAFNREMGVDANSGASWEAEKDANGEETGKYTLRDEDGNAIATGVSKSYDLNDAKEDGNDNKFAFATEDGGVVTGTKTDFSQDGKMQSFDNSYLKGEDGSRDTSRSLEYKGQNESGEATFTYHEDGKADRTVTRSEAEKMQGFTEGSSMYYDKSGDPSKAYLKDENGRVDTSRSLEFAGKDSNGNNTYKYNDGTGERQISQKEAEKLDGYTGGGAAWKSTTVDGSGNARTTYCDEQKAREVQKDTIKTDRDGRPTQGSMLDYSDKGGLKDDSNGSWSGKQVQNQYRDNIENKGMAYTGKNFESAANSLMGTEGDERIRFDTSRNNQNQIKITDGKIEIEGAVLGRREDKNGVQTTVQQTRFTQDATRVEGTGTVVGSENFYQGRAAGTSQAAQPRGNYNYRTGGYRPDGTSAQDRADFSTQKGRERFEQERSFERSMEQRSGTRLGNIINRANDRAERKANARARSKGKKK